MEYSLVVVLPCLDDPGESHAGTLAARETTASGFTEAQKYQNHKRLSFLLKRIIYLFVPFLSFNVI